MRHAMPYSPEALNARTREIMRERGCDWHAARAELARHAAAARRRNARLRTTGTPRAERARALADRISP